MAAIQPVQTRSSTDGATAIRFLLPVAETSKNSSEYHSWSSALPTLIREHLSELRRLCTRLAGDEGEDVLQETLFQIARHIGQFRGESSFRTWASAIARSQANRWFRKKRPGVGGELFCESTGYKGATANSGALGASAGIEGAHDGDPQRFLERHEVFSQLNKVLMRLPLLDREVYMARDIEKRSAAEVADELGLSVSAVKSRLFRARRLVRSQLVQSEPSEAVHLHSFDIAKTGND